MNKTMNYTNGNGTIKIQATLKLILYQLSTNKQLQF